ncbi:Transmembrane protein 26 [Amphibalanus amphitrite]|uniref:Transmembrane protein 26 n=2 Tax=Amphibalanus amphitrite TaxID=1232801 RepID=A0A6A4WKP1_AMPAM|nr:Transmembrane protein 26 [Amphibalanus amphitrite]
MDSPRSSSREGPTCEDWADMDIIAIVCTVLLQDGPFLLLRLVLIFRYKVVSYMNIFFTCKNSLVTSLQLYRLFVLCCERQDLRRSASEDDWESGSLSITESEAAHSSVRPESPGSATVTEVSYEPPPSVRRRRSSLLPSRRKYSGRDTPSTTAESTLSRRQLRRRQRLLQLAARQTARGSTRRREGSTEGRGNVQVDAVAGRRGREVGALPAGLSSSESELDVLRRAAPVETDDSEGHHTSRSLSFQCLRELEHLHWSATSRTERNGGEINCSRRKARPETLPGLSRLIQEEALVHHNNPQSPTSVKSVSFRHAPAAIIAPPRIHVEPPSRRMSIEVAPNTFSGRGSTRRDGSSSWRSTDGATGGRAPSPMGRMNLLRVLSKSISPVNGGSSGRQREEAGRTEGGRHRSRRKRQESYV